MSHYSIIISVILQVIAEDWVFDKLASLLNFHILTKFLLNLALLLTAAAQAATAREIEENFECALERRGKYERNDNEKQQQVEQDEGLLAFGILAADED